MNLVDKFSNDLNLFQKQKGVRSMKLTTRAIAAEAGVSPATVSRYCTGSENVSPELAKKIEDALQRMGQNIELKRGAFLSTAVPFRSCWIRKTAEATLLRSFVTIPVHRSLSAAL